MNPLYGTLPHVYAGAVTRGDVIAHRYTYAPHHCERPEPLRIAGHLFPSQCLRGTILVTPWNDLSDPVFDGVGLAGFKSRANAFLLA